ncbi:MAG: hypothetical protein JXA60_10570 [Candidatus Coatesbacteria bacterium]|nr:hypothetical protein [Candidatus Coatesbacteria bacterium]
MRKGRYLVQFLLVALFVVLAFNFGCGDDETDNGTGTGTGTGTSTGTQTLTVKAFIHNTGDVEDGFIKEAYLDEKFIAALDPMDGLQKAFSYRLYAEDGYNSHQKGNPDIAEFQFLMGGLNYQEENTEDIPRSRFDDSVMTKNDGEDHGLVSGHSVKQVKEIACYRAFKTQFSDSNWGIYELDALKQETHTFRWTKKGTEYTDTCKGIQLKYAVPEACWNSNYKFTVVATDGYYTGGGMTRLELTWDQFSTGWYKIEDGAEEESKDKAYFDESKFTEEQINNLRTKTPYLIEIIGTEVAIPEAHSEDKPVLGVIYTVPDDVSDIAEIQIKYTPH